MQKHLDQAIHNQEFHTCICDSFEEQFFDWKITVLFYVAIHCLKALAESKGIDIGSTHFDIEKNVNPEKYKPSMSISKNAWYEYRNLYNYSRTARYDGITDPDTFELLRKQDHLHCLRHLEKFKMYIENQGLKF